MENETVISGKWIIYRFCEESFNALLNCLGVEMFNAFIRKN
jgi:hypothetical protein